MRENKFIYFEFLSKVQKYVHKGSIKKLENIGWFSGNFIEHKYGEKAKVKTDEFLFIPAKFNLEVIVDCYGNLDLYDHFQLDLIETLGARYASTDTIFNKENIVKKEKNRYIFKTKYSETFDDVLTLDYIDKIPREIRKKHVFKIPEKLKNISNKLKEDSLKNTNSDNIVYTILFPFFFYVKNRRKNYLFNGFKKIERLTNEISENDNFKGACMEGTTLYNALCNSVGLPARRVSGKNLKKGGHVWSEVCVPTKDSYRWIPVDATLGFFNSFYIKKHMVFSKTPDYSISFYFKNMFLKKPEEMFLTINHID